MNIIIRNGHLIDPLSGRESRAEILIENEKIKKIADRIDIPDAGNIETIDATGCIIVPGLIDMHVHFREPGREDVETIAGGAKVAAKSGFTTVCTMPNTTPVTDTPSSLDYINEKAEGCPVNILPIANITKGAAGLELTDMDELVKHGAIAFTDDGLPVMSALMMRKALELSKKLNKPVITHSEDISLSGKGVMNEGANSAALGLEGIPNESEEIMIARDAILARLTGGRLHIAHTSSAGSVEIIKRAKEDGISITCEATPHHFSLTDDAVKTHRTLAKMNPPLRTEKDRLAVIKGLRSGIIDIIATDHAPHSKVDKEKGMQDAPFGIIGLETAVPLVITVLVKENNFSYLQAFRLLTSSPAEILGIDRGRLAENCIADITIINPDKKIHVDENFLLSKCKNTPFIGRDLYGSVEYTIRDGAVVYRKA